MIDWRTHLRGHLLLFDAAAAPRALPVGRLLLAAAAMEIARLAALQGLRPQLPLWLLLPAMLVVALLLVPRIAGAKLIELGFKPWREWSLTERSYFVQVLCLANLVFLLLFGARVGAQFATVFLPYLCFGFYQELIYRGLVQRALVQRWGAPVGIVVANALYCFGPLHAHSSGPMFAAVFAIGLFFGLLFRRSGNLWLAAIFHAIGNAYIVAAL